MSGRPYKKRNARLEADFALTRARVHWLLARIATTFPKDRDGYINAKLELLGELLAVTAIAEEGRPSKKEPSRAAPTDMSPR